MVDTESTRCGVVAIIGEPNAGKSTLLNQLVGTKLSIVTPKVQTTRFNVRGVCMEGAAQLIFVDTPGIFDAGKRFEKAMVGAAWAGAGDADAVLLLLDAQAGIKERFTELVQRLKQLVGKPVFLALNKVDAIDKPTLFTLAQQADAFGLFQRIFMISALTGDGVPSLKVALAAAMPQGPWHYPADQASDIPLRLLAAEITREKLFMKLEQELPYALLVETEKWEEGEKNITIAQVIYVQRDGQKGIVIGKGGQMLKSVGMAARRELEALTEKKIHLELFVKVRPDWKETRDAYRLLGLEFKA
jgi:GTP-binding protein Era